MKRDKKKIIIIIICILLTVLAVLFVFIFKDSLSLYSSKASGNDSGKVANFSLNINETTAAFPYEIGMNKPTSGTKYYKFDVSNKVSTRIGEVEEDFVLVLTSTRNIPIDITLYQVDKASYDAATLTSATLTGATQIATATYPTDVIMSTTGKFKPKEEGKYYYILKTTWNTKYDSYIYQDKVDLINVRVDYEQVS